MGSRSTFHTKSNMRIDSGGRNFIISIDGTWNDPTDAEESGSGVTNVLRLHEAIDRNDEDQYARYFPGVGNDMDNTFLGKMFGGIFGFGAKQIRNEAYVALVTNYHPGDNIFIFGFSRGAAIARMLCNLIEKRGIPKKITIYKNSEGRVVGFNASREKVVVNINMLGVWDTVASFGIPVDLFGIPFHDINLFSDLTISKRIDKAYHLLAIDENRDAFMPTLMNHDPGIIDEVWFSGVHADVGGGYDKRRLADITLKYMIDKAHALGVSFYEPCIDEILSNNKGLGVIHTHAKHLGNFKMGWRDICIKEKNEVNRSIKPQIHKSVFERMQNKEYTYRPASIIRLIGEFYNPDALCLPNEKYDVVE